MTVRGAYAITLAWINGMLGSLACRRWRGFDAQAIRSLLSPIPKRIKLLDVAFYIGGVIRCIHIFVYLPLLQRQEEEDDEDEERTEPVSGAEAGVSPPFDPTKP